MECKRKWKRTSNSPFSFSPNRFWKCEWEENGELVLEMLVLILVLVLFLLPHFFHFISLFLFKSKEQEEGRQEQLVYHWTMGALPHDLGGGAPHPATISWSPAFITFPLFLPAGDSKTICMQSASSVTGLYAGCWGNLLVPPTGEFG